MGCYLRSHERLGNHTGDLPAKARSPLFFLCSNRAAERALS